MTHYAAPGWYGKLPSSGDFVKRRFPDVLYRQWSNWFQVGLHHWQTSEESKNAPSRAFLKAPVWNFVVPPMLGSQLIQMGCLIAARDSVGRNYPLCALRHFTPPSGHRRCWPARASGISRSAICCCAWCKTAVRQSSSTRRC